MNYNGFINGVGNCNESKVILWESLSEEPSEI